MANKLADFFKHSDTEFGVFYPKHYLIAIFPALPDAENARSLLQESGWKEEDLLAVPGQEVVDYQENHLEQQGLWALLMAQASRFFSTEQPYVDADLAAAKRGAAFLAAHCSNEESKNKAWEILKQTNPQVVRYYPSAGIEHLMGER